MKMMIKKMFRIVFKKKYTITLTKDELQTICGVFSSLCKQQYEIWMKECLENRKEKTELLCLKNQYEDIMDKAYDVLEESEKIEMNDIFHQ